MFKSVDFAEMLMFRKEGFLYDQEAEAQALRWRVLQAAATAHGKLLNATVGAHTMTLIAGSLRVGPLDTFAPGSARPVAVPAIATMYKTA